VDIRLPVAQVVAIAILSLAAIACQGEQVSDRGTLEAEMTPSGSPVGPGLVEGTPIITDSLFQFPAKGYSVVIPDGWSPRPNVRVMSNVSIDAFFSPSQEAGFQPNIAVTREAIDPGTTLESYFQAKMDVVEGVTGTRPEGRVTQVAGQEAYVAEYTPTKDSPWPDKTDVVFVNERYGWIISLTVPQGRRADYQGVLDEFVASFQLLPQ